MTNIYNAIQNLYHMDKETWQEVLSEMYTLVNNTSLKFDTFEQKFLLHLGNEVTKELKKMYNDGRLGDLINDVLLKDINTKVDNNYTTLDNKIDTVNSELNSQLNTKANKNKVSPSEFNDDIQACLNYASEYGYNVEFPSNKTYYITETIYLPINISINFNNSIIRTDNDIVMLSTKDGEKLNNVKIENLIVRGSGNPNHTNNIGLKFASIYGIFENITMSYCYNGIVQHSEGIAGNQVTNVFRNIKIRYVYDVAMNLGGVSGNGITDGWLENINLGSGLETTPQNHLVIGMCSGYFLKDIHTWGSCETSLKLYDVAHTNVDGLYIESFNKRAIDLHLKSECNMSNIKTIFNSNDECFMYLSGANTSLYNKYVLNINNVVVGGNDTQLTGLTVFNAENKNTINLNYSNIDINLPATFNANTSKLKAKAIGIISTNKNELCVEDDFVLSRTFKKKISSETNVSVDIPIAHTFNGNAGTMVNLQICLARYWDDFNNNMRLNKNLYLHCKNGGDVKIKEYDLETTEGFTSNPIITFNDGMINITFEKDSSSNGWLFATLL